MENSALSGTLVVDLTQHIAGPFCTKLLADFGAEVIKVEPPGKGDVARHMPPFLKDDPHLEKSGLFLYLNNNKYGITLDIEKPEGKELLETLIDQADILVEDFEPGEMGRLGFSYDALQEKYPDLVITSITPFGQDGPYSQFKAQQIVLQAMGGWMHTLGDPDREPLQVGGDMGYFVGGYTAALATSAALYFRNSTGIGQHIDLSLMEAHLRTQQRDAHMYFMTQQVPRRFASWFPGILKARDGYLGIHILTDPQWEYLCEYMGTEDLVDDSRFHTHRDRLEKGKEVVDRFQEFVKDRAKEEVFYEGMERRIPMALAYSAEEMLSSPKYLERNFFVGVDHPVMGSVQQPGAPFKLSATPWRLKRPAPLLGEHNELIYSQYLGVDKEGLMELQEEGVI